LATKISVATPGLRLSQSPTWFGLFDCCGLLLLFVKPLSKDKAAIQAIIAREDFPTSAHGESADQNINRAGLNAMVSAFVVDPRSALMIAGMDRSARLVNACFQARALRLAVSP
jgi:hypothetical protein